MDGATSLRRRTAAQAVRAADILHGDAVLDVAGVPEPLDRFLARRLRWRWSDVHQAIQKKRVRVDGAAANRYHLPLPPGARVEVDGAAIADGPDDVVIVCHKPPGCACSHAPEDAPLLYDLVPAALRHPDLQAAGRLDRDTTGLLVLTIDGRLIQRLTAPKQQLWKRYRLRWSGRLADDAVARCAAGLAIDGDDRPCLPARLTIDAVGDDGGAATLEICEGRRHQVKRMIRALGGEVVRLHRDRIGALDLPGDLALGEFRPARAEELALMP